MIFFVCLLPRNISSIRAETSFVWSQVCSHAYHGVWHMEIKRAGFRECKGAGQARGVQEPHCQRDWGSFTGEGGWSVLVITLVAATGVRMPIDHFTLPYPHPFPAIAENPPTWLWLSALTCFGPWDVSNGDANRGFKSPHSVGSAALALRHRHHWENRPG